MKHFTIAELSASATARRLGIDNTPTPAAEDNLRNLVRNILDPLREAWGGPISVSSGYRCAALNRAVGGVNNSQHLYGQAADISAGSREANRRLWHLALDRKLPFDQLIDERDMAWIHISWAPLPRGQTLHL